MDARLGVGAVAAILLGSASTHALAQAASAPVGAVSSAPAADPSVQVSEVVVTAQRREQSILSVPIAVTAASGAALEAKGVTNSAQLDSVVPNLQVNSAYGETQPNFSLRGVSVANEYNSNQVSPIGVYINDVYIVSRTSQGMGLFDLDRVEVLRGPQGTLFGRNTTGGAINFITREPSLQGSNGYAEIGYGNYHTVHFDAAGETTFADDQVGVRAAVNYEAGDGEFKNVYPGGKDPDSTHTLEGRISLRVRPHDSPLDVKIVLYGGRNDPTQAPVFGLQSARQGLSFFQVDENRVGNNKTESFGASANVTYTLSPSLKLISITSVDGGNQDLQQAADGSPLDILDITWRSQFRQLSEEARLDYSSDRLNLIAGVYYGRDTTVTDNTFDIGGALGPGVNGGFFQHYNQQRQSYAVFTQGDIKFTQRLTLTLGLRYTADRAQYEDGNAYLFLGNVGGPQTPLATTVPCAGPPGSCAFDPAARFGVTGQSNAPTGRVALSYTFDSGLLVYASYDRGYRAGAFNGGGYTSSSGITYVKPETVNAYEIGAKGRFLDRRLTLSAAAFYYDYSNQQVQDTAPGPVSFLVNAPNSRIYGAEAEATFRVVPRFTLNGSIGLLQAKYLQLSLQDTNLAGNDLPFAPHLTVQGGFDWLLFHLAGGEVTLSPSVDHVSQQYFSPFDTIDAAGSGEDNAELQQGAYTKVNASLAWTRGNVVLRAWADNLTNAEVLGYGLDLRGAGFPFNFLVPEPPRTFGVAARVSF
ncbi:MAG TPA: TonB-dependent receptor [Caulobacteraceae bacterium]|nr:TonB-dependent receptor [Caulobacteraceae bacterium]